MAETCRNDLKDAVTGAVVVQMGGGGGEREGERLTLKIPLEAVCFLQEGKIFLLPGGRHVLRFLSGRTGFCRFCAQVVEMRAIVTETALRSCFL